MISNGIDLVEIEKVEKAIESESFRKRVYGEAELRELESKRAESYAAAFCAKEAFSKAVGTGLSGFDLREVEVLHDENGKPYFKLSGRAKELADELNFDFALSLTHTKDYAAAMVTAFTREK